MTKKIYWTPLVAILAISVLCGLNVNTSQVSAVESPSITIVPDKILDETLVPGDNVTISLYTDYNGSDVWSYQFTLSYNSSVLRGGVNKTDTWTGNGVTDKFYTTYTPMIEGSEYVWVNGTLQILGTDYLMNYGIGEVWFAPWSIPGVGANITAKYLYGVVNGDLITGDPSAEFEPGTFNETLGELSLTVGWFFYMAPADPYVTSGPGILANVTFTVVGYGFSHLTLGFDTILIGYNTITHEPYDIINAKIDADHIRHGYFSDKIPGDIDGDKDVDPFDFSAFRVAYGSKGPPQKDPADANYNLQADLDLDGDVDPFDFSTFRVNYGKTI